MLPSSLPMNVFEEYMLLDSSPIYPMECNCRFRFSDGFDHEILESALAEVLQNHPFLYSHCRERKNSRFNWVIPTFGPTREERIRHKETHTEILGVHLMWLEGKCRTPQYPHEVRELLDIWNEAMIRFFIVEEKDENGKVVRSDFILKCHHSATDGKGVFRFFADLLIEYARQKERIEEPGWKNIPAIRLETLLTRHWYGMGLLGWARQLLFCMMNIPRSIRFITRPVQPCFLKSIQQTELVKKSEEEGIQPDSELVPKNPPHAQFPTILFRKFTPEESTRILNRCHEKKCTFNDAMLQAVWCGTKAWREKHPDVAYSGPKKWIRIAIPLDMRNPSQQNCPASNIVSMVFCDRQEPEIDTSDAVLRDIQKEMFHVKRFRLGFLLIEGMKDVVLIFGNLKKVVKMCDCWSTVVLTNLGPMFTPKQLPFTRDPLGKIRIGDLILDEMDSASPIRPQTNFSICCATYAGEMQLSMIYDTILMDRELADDYFTLVLEKMKEILEMS
ncbi:MAG: hypothetical protein ACI4UF_03135 [Thermoguttaceae bacterium]